MAKFPIAGPSVNVQYGWESTYGTAATTLNKAFGQQQKISAYDIDNSADYVYALGSQDAQATVAKEFKGGWGAEFALSDPWWLRSILGAAPVTSGAGPYTHYWTTAVSGISNTMPSMTIDLGFDLDSDSRHILLGAVTNSATISANVGEIIKVKLDGVFGNESKSGTLASTYSGPVEQPMVFSQATLELPSGTTIGDVQSLELTWNRNPEVIYSLGSRFGQNVVAKQREWNIKATVLYEQDSDFMNSVLGSASGAVAAPAEVATLRTIFTNGLSTTSTRSYTTFFSNVFVEKVSIPVSVEDLVKQEITMRARTFTNIVVVNNTSAAL